MCSAGDCGGLFLQDEHQNNRGKLLELYQRFHIRRSASPCSSSLMLLQSIVNPKLAQRRAHKGKAYVTVSELRNEDG